MKIITWIDFEGRYRVTSPAYNDRSNPSGETEAETIARVWSKVQAHYGLPDNHMFHLVEDADQRARLAECCGTYFRYGVFDTDARAGAWEMDTDGRPKVNMAKARQVQMDKIRVVRNVELEKLGQVSLRAIESSDTDEQQRIATEKQTLRDIPQTFDLNIAATPDALKDRWPPGLRSP